MKRALILSLGLMLPLAASWPAHAQLFGESDEEKAARQQHEDGQDSQINQLSGRIKDLEDRVHSLTDSLSQATGANEQLSHQLDLMNTKLDRQQKDFAYRLCMLSAQQLGAGSDGSGLNCAAAGTASASAPPPGGMSPGNAGGTAPGTPLPPLGSDGPAAGGSSMGGTYDTGDAAGAPVRLGRPSGTLGTLSGSGPSGGSMGGDAGPPPPAPSGGNSGQFDAAMNLLAKAQYPEASAAFRAYADTNTGDTDLAPQAIYWVGDIAFVQSDYPNAARAFAEQIKKYPTSSRSPDSMLKLGQSLLQEGQTDAGCTTLAALKSKYPKPPASTLTAAAGARKAACR